MSPLAWGRGLKLELWYDIALAVLVAPRVGAWIETLNDTSVGAVPKSPLAWGRGLKPWYKF